MKLLVCTLLPSLYDSATILFSSLGHNRLVGSALLRIEFGHLISMTDRHPLIGCSTAHIPLVSAPRHGTTSF